MTNMQDIYSLNQTELSLQQRMDFGLYPANMTIPLERINPAWFFFGISALWMKTGVKISQTVRSCGDRATRLNGKWECIENIIESIAFFVGSVVASGTALSTVVKREEETGNAYFRDLELMCNELKICDYHGSDDNHVFYGTQNEGKGYLHHFTINTDHNNSPVTITRAEDGSILIVHMNAKTHPAKFKRADDYQGQTLSGYTVDTKYCHPFGSLESINHANDWDTLHSQLMCKKNVGSGHSNSIKMQIYDHNKQTTIGAFQSAFRQGSDFSKLKCPTGLSDGIHCSGAYTS